jgi:hypothetical protein
MQALLIERTAPTNLILMGIAPRSAADSQRFFGRLGVPLWGRLLICYWLAPATLLFAGALVTLEIQLSRMSGHIEAIPLKISQNFTDQAKQYAEAGKDEAAQRFIELAQGAVATAAEQKVKANPRFFQRQISTIGDISHPAPTLVGPIHDLRVTLAEYHSAIEPPPPIRKKVNVRPDVKPLDIASLTEPVTLETDYGSDVQFIQSPGIDGFSRSPNYRFKNFNILTPNGATQQLDGIHWDNVVFIGTHIKYLGGDIDLKNVRFVQCRFNVAATEMGKKFLDYVALGQTTLNSPSTH